MQFTLGEIEAAIEATNSAGSPELRVSGWSIDSRTTSPGDLFFAIKGEKLDGHRFLDAAYERGAVAAVVSENSNADKPLLHVSDTVIALQRLSHFARQMWGGPLVAITGSAGKTTTKDITAALLATKFRVGKSFGNFNNHIGLPISLLRMEDDADIGVFELGMNHAGEIRALSAIAEPQYAVVTNVGYAHIEAFASIEGIALAKRELIESLPATGTAILNADDPRVSKFAEVHSGTVVTYGLSETATFRATDVQLRPEGNEFSVGNSRFHTLLAGQHNVSNILAGLAVARCFDLDLETLVNSVAGLKPGKMRGQRKLWRGITILDDSYNSNPEAARHMIDVLRAEPAVRHIAVLGEMLELGMASTRLHQELGIYVAELGVDVLIGVQGHAQNIVEAAVRVKPQIRAEFFKDAQSAGEFVRDFVQAGDAILFKGSRGTHVEIALATMES